MNALSAKPLWDEEGQVCDSVILCTWKRQLSPAQLSVPLCDLGLVPLNCSLVVQTVKWRKAFNLWQVMASSEVAFTRANILTSSDLFYSKWCYFLSHPSWENAGDIQESLENISANLCSPMEKYSSGVEEEDRKFSGKYLFFQREVRISTMK